MSTPLEVIQISQKKFDDQVSLLDSQEELSDFGYKLQEDDSVWTITDWGHIKAFQNTQTLALLQALHDELEGNRLTVDDFENSVYGRYPEFCAGMNQQNQFIQDQQDNLQAIMDKIRV